MQLTFAFVFRHPQEALSNKPTAGSEQEGEGEGKTVGPQSGPSMTSTGLSLYKAQAQAHKERQEKERDKDRDREAAMRQEELAFDETANGLSTSHVGGADDDGSLNQLKKPKLFGMFNSSRVRVNMMGMYTVGLLVDKCVFGRGERNRMKVLRPSVHERAGTTKARQRPHTLVQLVTEDPVMLLPPLNRHQIPRSLTFDSGSTRASVTQCGDPCQ